MELGKTDVEVPLEAHEIRTLFKGSKPETLSDLANCLEKRSCKAGEVVFERGDTDANLYLIRSGQLRIMGCVRRNFSFVSHRDFWPG